MMVFSCFGSIAKRLPLRLRHVFFAHVPGLSSSPIGVPKVPLRPLATDRFLPCLSSDLGGVWLFRIHCPKAALVRLSRLGCLTFFVYVYWGFFLFL